MDDKKEMLLEEWKDIRETLRYFGNKRFAQLSVFIAASGFMFDAFFKQSESSSRMTLLMVGVVLGILFIIMERSSVQYWEKYSERGKAIERDTGVLEMMTRHRPEEKSVSATKATYFLYGGVVFLWLLASFAVNAVNPRDAAEIVRKAQMEAPSYASGKQFEWMLSSLNWDPSSRTYRLVLRNAALGESMAMTMDGATGRVIRVDKPGS